MPRLNLESNMRNLPETSLELSRLLARRLGAAAIIIGFVAGAVSFLLETHRTEQAAFENAMNGVRHFESPAMQMAADAKLPVAHDALNRLLDRNRFVGIRVFSPEKRLIYEAWSDVPVALRDAAGSLPHEWPVRGQSQQSRMAFADEHLIQIVLPLSGKDGTLLGYLEGISRLDEQTLRAQREQARNGALTAIVSVLITAFLLYPLLLAMLRRSIELSRRLLNSNISLIRSLGNAVAKRDSDTDAHNYRVTLYAVALAETLQWTKPEIAHLMAGAFLHDVGKIGIPDHILLKPGKLTVEEFEIMKTHALLGLDIIAGNPWMNAAAPVIRNHHERFDGSGYPDALIGSEIPRGARLFAVVDVFDALLSKRPYKASMPLNEALLAIQRESGSHFDPEVVTAFNAIAGRLHQEVVMASDSELRARLRSAIACYFKTEATDDEADISLAVVTTEGDPS